MPEEVLVSVDIPKIVIDVEVVGSNSLLGALCKELSERNVLMNVNILHTEKLVFNIHRVHPEVNIYEELNAVRDFLKMEEKRIQIFVR